MSVVLPVYRNAETLDDLYSRLCEVLERLRLEFELIFVNDACPAGSLAVLQALARQDGRVAVVALERNVGQREALLRGLSCSRGQRTVMMDADLQDPPEAIPDLLERLREGFSAVFAGRRGLYESRWRLVTSRLFKRLLHVAAGVPIDAGLFAALDRSVRRRLLSMQGPSAYLVAMIGSAGLPVASVPVVRASRPEGGSSYSFAGRLRSGFRALVWVVSWKWLGGRAILRGGRAKPVAARYIGARFG